MAHLVTLSDAVYDSLLPSYKDVLDNLKERASVWNEVAATAHYDDENGEKTSVQDPRETTANMATPTSSTWGLTRASTI